MRLRWRSRKLAESPTPATASAATQTQPSPVEGDSQPQTAAPKTPVAEAAKEPEAGRADPHERLDGLRLWLAQVERRLGIRTYALAAAAVLALAAGIVALVIALQAQEDSATKGELQSVSDQIGEVEKSASQAAERDVRSLSRRVDGLETKLSQLENRQGGVRDQLSVVEDDIDDLRDQISELEASSAGGGPESP